MLVDAFDAIKQYTFIGHIHPRIQLTIILYNVPQEHVVLPQSASCVGYYLVAHLLIGFVDLQAVIGQHCHSINKFAIRIFIYDSQPVANVPLFGKWHTG